jgi:hypothetical protein
MDTLITQVLRQVPSDVTHEHALSALRKHNNDVQNAVLDILGPSVQAVGGQQQKQKSLTEHEEHWRKMREICNDMEKSMYAAATSASASANAKTT